ncbi:MAG TPA: ABC transporter substrate-binding protein [Candidatus Binatia bacterium]|nr:ABC transporter substrate-binding protein [Candidatus Binatia bacterium]
MSRTLLGLLILALAAAPLSGSAAEPYEISVILPVTGPGAFVAHVEINSLTVIEQMTNKAGGIRGRPIRFVVQDDQSNPAVSVQLLNGIIAKKAPFVLGSTLAATCNATAALLKDGPVQYCFSPGVHPAAGSYQYSAGVDTGALLAAATRYLRERKLTKVAVITSTDATGQDADRFIDAIFGSAENRAMTLVAREHFNTADINVAAQLARIKAAGADVLIAWTTGASFGTILRGVRDTAIDIPVVSTPGNMLASQLRQYTNIMPKELFFPNMASFLTPDQLPNGPLKNKVAGFYDAFKAAGLRPPSGEGQVWDQILITLSALQKFGFDATPAQIHSYIDNLHGWFGINGSYDFRKFPQRGVGIDVVIVQQWDPAKEAGIPVSRPGGAEVK